MTDHQAIAHLLGIRFAGGCPDCDAWQEMRRQPDGVYVITISHDPTCPTWQQNHPPDEADP
jgi:hypothetical protein